MVSSECIFAFFADGYIFFLEPVFLSSIILTCSPDSLALMTLRGQRRGMPEGLLPSLWLLLQAWSPARAVR